MAHPGNSNNREGPRVCSQDARAILRKSKNRNQPCCACEGEDKTSNAPYDLAVIGGGINGCGIARDAAGRGLRVILFEQTDLAGATSSASTKLTAVRCKPHDGDMFNTDLALRCLMSTYGPPAHQAATPR